MHPYFVQRQEEMCAKAGIPCLLQETARQHLELAKEWGIAVRGSNFDGNEGVLDQWHQLDEYTQKNYERLTYLPEESN